MASAQGKKVPILEIDRDIGVDAEDSVLVHRTLAPFEMQSPSCDLAFSILLEELEDALDVEG